MCIRDRKRVAQLFEKLALLAGQLRRHFHLDVHVDVAAPAAIHRRHAQMPQTELRAVLGAFRDPQAIWLFQRGDFDFRTQRGLSHVDRDGAVQIVALAFEEGVLLDLQDHVQIALSLIHI